jgi:hypothetical protein
MRNPFGTPVSVRILLFGGVGSAAALSIASRMSLACAGCIRARTFPASTILNCRIAFWPPRGRDWRHVSHTWRPRLFLMTNGSTKMTQSDSPGTHPSIQDVALIVGGGPGISSSCARLFAKSGMRVGVAARTRKAGPGGPGEDSRRSSIRVRRKRTSFRGVAVPECRSRPRGAYACRTQHRRPGSRHFCKGITEANPAMVLETLRNSAFSAFLVGQQAARLMRENKMNANGTKGTIVFTNASAALTGFPSRGAFAMAYHAKSGSHRAWQGN